MARPKERPAAKQPQRTAPAFEAQLATLYAAGLKARLLAPARKRAAGAQGPDARLRIDGPQGPKEWAVEHTARLDERTLGPLMQRLRDLATRDGRALLFTDHVTPRIAERLRELGLAFVDAAGNAHLVDEGLYLFIQGRKPEPQARGTRRALHAAGWKLVFALLQGTRAGTTHRELAERAGIALGGVGRILRELELRGWIRVRPEGRIDLVERAALLRAWDEGYLHTLRAKLFVRTCRARPGTDLDAIVAAIAKVGLEDQVEIGGELGATLWTRTLRPARAALHIRDVDPADVMRRLELLPDRNGPIDLFAAFGARTPRAPEDEVTRAQTPRAPEDEVTRADPLLVHAELLALPDDRRAEAAERIRVECIEPRLA